MSETSQEGGRRLRQPSDAQEGQARSALIERAIRLRDDIKIEINTVEHWNRMHPAEDPIDPDPHGEYAELLRYLDRFIAANVE